MAPDTVQVARIGVLQAGQASYASSNAHKRGLPRTRRRERLMLATEASPASHVGLQPRPAANARYPSGDGPGRGGGRPGRRMETRPSGGSSTRSHRLHSLLG